MFILRLLDFISSEILFVFSGKLQLYSFFCLLRSWTTMANIYVGVSDRFVKMLTNLFYASNRVVLFRYTFDL